jgi:predicted ATP-dependent endonuclease of OLD family
MIDQMNNKYSFWQKIDLHIHTDWSKKTKNNDYSGIFSVKMLHEKLTEQKVEIFSLTDHNIINLGAYKEYYEKFCSDSDSLLLLGIELDIERNDKTYHSLLIFDCDNYDSAKRINDRLEEKFKEKDLPIMERKLTIEDIIDTFPEDDFFFIPHAGNTASIVDGYKGEIEEAQKMLILFQSPLEKVPEKKRQIYNDNFGKILYDAFRNKDDYAYIEFSDNHNIQRYPCKHKGDSGDHEFYYIKGSKNYETLRLAFIDPKSRIKSSEELCNINQERNYIETLNIKSNSYINDSTLEFSPHLNVIIGGRSSGKSLLMDILSRMIDQLGKETKYDFIEEGLESTIKSKFDEGYKTITSFDTSIIQINQGDIVNFFEKNKLEELAQKTGKTEQYNEAKDNFRGKKTELEGCINDLINRYKNAFNLDISKKVIIHNHVINKYLSNEFLFIVDVDSIKDLHEQHDILSENCELLSSLIDGIDKLNKSGYFDFSKEEYQSIKSFDELIRKKKEEVDKDISIRNLIDAFLGKVNHNINVANSQLSSEGQEKAQAQSSIKEKITDIGILFKSLYDLRCITERLETYNISHKEEIGLDSCSKLCLEVNSNDQISELIIDGIKDADCQNLYICLLKLLYKDYAIKNYGNNIPENLEKKINKQLEYLFSDFDNPSDFLEYNDGSNSKNNSPGYNSEKYLQEILDNPSSNIILIDQPEDNLGNKFISDELVNFIRELKFKKQLFLVTHNPAIVVYGDAESIICAQNNNNRISYDQIKLEDVSSQKEICSILDGGEYIFDNRARKYNIQKLLTKEE